MYLIALGSIYGFGMHRLSSRTNDGLHLIIPFRHSAFDGHGKHFKGVGWIDSTRIVESQNYIDEGEVDDEDEGNILKPVRVDITEYS